MQNNMIKRIQRLQKFLINLKSVRVKFKIMDQAGTF